jgi:prepilin-type N-terminal cleavage/methylation domain-containing protein
MLMNRIRALRHDERGFTLPELLTAMIIGLLIIFAALDMLDTTVSLGTRVNKRVDAAQRGRNAMDRITRDLRSQVCIPGATPLPSLAGATDNTVDFYADLSDSSGAQPPTHRVLTFNPTAKTITEDIYVPTGSAGAYSFPTTPSRTQVLLTDVVQNGSTPVFRFYPLDTTPDDDVDPSAIDGTSALDSDELDSVARIAVMFKALPNGAASTSSGASVFQDQVFRRAVDPNATDPTPSCS